MPPNQRWKRREREIAAALGGERVPSSGRARSHDSYAPDVFHPYLSIEVKARKATPKLLREAIAQAALAAKRDKEPGKMPVAILCEHGRALSNAHVILRFEDFLKFVAYLDNETKEV